MAWFCLLFVWKCLFRSDSLQTLWWYNYEKKICLGTHVTISHFSIKLHIYSPFPVYKLNELIKCDNVSLLCFRERVTRHQYYLQLRENVLQARQLCAEERCFLLAAYALQADLGSYNTHKHARSYFDPREYFPAWVCPLLYPTQHLWKYVNTLLFFKHLNHFSSRESTVGRSLPLPFSEESAVRPL